MLTHSVNWDVFIYWDRGPQRHGSLHHLALKLKRKVTELSCQVLGVGLIEDNSYGVGQEGEAARQAHMNSVGQTKGPRKAFKQWCIDQDL